MGSFSKKGTVSLHNFLGKRIQMVTIVRKNGTFPERHCLEKAQGAQLHGISLVKGVRRHRSVILLFRGGVLEVPNFSCLGEGPTR